MQVLAWIKTPIGDSARKEEYAKKLPDVEKAFADAVALTKEKRAEPPLPYNIFHRDQVCVSTKMVVCCQLPSFPH